MRIEVENGTILEFPDDAGEAEIDAGVNEYLAGVEQQPAQPDNSFMGKLEAIPQERGAQMRGIADQAVAGDISEAEAIGRIGVKSAMMLPDAAGAVLSEGFEALPQSWQDTATEGVSSGINAIANTNNPFAEGTLGDVASKAIQGYKDFAQQHPTAAGRIETVADVGSLAAPFARVGGKSAISAATDVAEPAVKGAVKGAGAVGGKVASALTPDIDDNFVEMAQLAQKHGVPVSFDQVSPSNAVKAAQKVSQDVPFAGQAGFRDKQVKAWQKGIFKTIGMNESKFTPETMSKAFSKVGGEFDALTKDQKFEIGGSFIDDVASKLDEIETSYGSDAAKAFEKEAVKVMGAFSGDVVDGSVIASQRARINALARKATGENKFALQDLEAAIIDGITSKDPVLKQALTTAKHRYKNLIVVEPLAVKAKGGNISPTLLNNRVARVYGRAHTTGKSGDIGELARIGYELLPVLGGSDTATRLMYGVGALGGAVANAPLATAAVVGNRAIQSGINRNQSLIKRSLSDKIGKLDKLESPSLKTKIEEK